MIGDIIYAVSKARKEYLEPEFNEVIEWAMGPLNVCKVVWLCIDEKDRAELTLEKVAIAIQMDSKNGGFAFGMRWRQLSGLETEPNPENSATAS